MFHIILSLINSQDFVKLPLVSREMKSEKRAQKFHTDDVSLSRSGWCLWLVEKFLPPIRSTTQIWAVTSHQYGISTLVPQTSFREETGDGLAKCRLFSQANNYFCFIFFSFRRFISSFRKRWKNRKVSRCK